MEIKVKSRLLVIDSEKFDREMMNRIFGKNIGIDKDVQASKKVMESFDPAVFFMNCAIWTDKFIVRLQLGKYL
jgi:hypothetical protein